MLISSERDLCHGLDEWHLGLKNIKRLILRDFYFVDSLGEAGNNH